MYIYIANYNFEKYLEFEWNIDFLFNIAYEKPSIFCNLSNVDPYWKTIFNKLQVENSILNEIKNIEWNKKDIMKFIIFLNKIEQHDFLIIVWD